LRKQNVLKSGYSLLAEKAGNLDIRLRMKAEAEKFVQQMREWGSSPKPLDGVASGISNVDFH
jgi:hypothetical protein